MRVVEDAVDPLLAGAANRSPARPPAISCVLLADDVLLPAGTLDRMRAAFARMPSLGAALPAVPGAAGGELATDVQYADLTELRALRGAARRRARARRRADRRRRDARDRPARARRSTPSEASIPRTVRRAAASPTSCCDCARPGTPSCAARTPWSTASHRISRTVPPPRSTRAPRCRPSISPRSCAASIPPSASRSMPTSPRRRRRNASVAIAVAVRDEAELDAAAAFLGAAAAAFDARSPVRVHLVLDGAIAPARAAARIRPVLASSGSPLKRASRSASSARRPHGVARGVGARRARRRRRRTRTRRRSTVLRVGRRRRNCARCWNAAR